MQHISALILFLVFISFNHAIFEGTQAIASKKVAPDEIDPKMIDDCLEMAGGSAHLMAYLY